MLGYRLFAAEDTLGALDLYGYDPGVFDESSRAIAAVLASHTAMALAGAQLHEHDLDTVANLREALVARDVIGQAKGILMATRSIDADAAFRELVRASQSQNVKLRTIAEEVARTGHGQTAGPRCASRSLSGQLHAEVSRSPIYEQSSWVSFATETGASAGQVWLKSRSACHCLSPQRSWDEET